MVKTKSSKKVSFRKYSKKKTPRSKKVSSSVKKYVQRTIKANAENKKIQYKTGFVIRSYADDNLMNVFPLSLGTAIPVSQGTGQADRIGNKVKIVKAMLNYTISPTVYDALVNPTPEPTLLRLFIGYSKTNPTVTPSASDFAVLFQAGNSSIAPTGYIEDMQRTINTDRWVVYRSPVHKIGCASYTGAGTSTGNQYYTNNDFKYLVMRKINLIKYIKSICTWNDTTVQPTSRGLFGWIAVVGADNTQLTGTITTKFNYFIDIEYEDV